MCLILICAPLSCVASTLAGRPHTPLQQGSISSIVAVGAAVCVGCKSPPPSLLRARRPREGLDWYSAAPSCEAAGICNGHLPLVEYDKMQAGGVNCMVASRLRLRLRGGMEVDESDPDFDPAIKVSERVLCMRSSKTVHKGICASGFDCIFLYQIIAAGKDAFFSLAAHPKLPTRLYFGSTYFVRYFLLVICILASPVNACSPEAAAGRCGAMTCHKALEPAQMISPIEILEREI